MGQISAPEIGKNGVCSPSGQAFAAAAAAITCDTFFNGRIRLKQNRCGYRYSIDAVILARSVRVRPKEKVLDLGTGCGIIPVILAFSYPEIRIWGVEIQAQLALLAADNVRDNGMCSRISVLHADMRQIVPEALGGPVDLVVSNPPYYRVRSGRTNPDEQRAIARHEINMTLSDLIRCARRMLKNGGRLITIHSAERTAELLFWMRSEHIEPKRLRSIHSAPQTNAQLILVEGVKEGKPGISISSPLVVYDGKGEYSKEIKRLFCL
jgi:tRNA1Val (adenine37-N6)-methyltransferase